jgi:proteasome lid subunit RPN8/RPN11
MSSKSQSGVTPPILKHDIDQSDCVKIPFPLRELNLVKRPVGFQVIIRRSVLNEIKRLGRASMKKEVGGMLVGVVGWDNAPFLLIEASIEGKYTNDKQASVTFTAETWDYVHEELEKNYPQKKIVGWYHTHPGFGIFLSSYDVFIQENFFRELWQTAFVFDPHAETDGFFIWQNAKVPTKPNIKPLVIEDEPEEKIIKKQISISNSDLGLESNSNSNSDMSTNNFKMQEKTNGNWIDVLVSILLAISIVALFVCIVSIFMINRRLDTVEKRLDKAEKQIKSILQPKNIDRLLFTREGNDCWKIDLGVDDEQTQCPIEQKKITPLPESRENIQLQVPTIPTKKDNINPPTIQKSPSTPKNLTNKN